MFTSALIIFHYIRLLPILSYEKFSTFHYPDHNDVRVCCGSGAKYFQGDNFAETRTDALACGEVQGYIFGDPESNERGYCVFAAPEQDGFYLAGSRSGRVMITKMALNGNIYWARTFDVVPGNDEHVHSMIVDSDGMIAISGTSGNSPLGSPCFVIRYDPYNNLVLWAKEYSFDLENFSIIEKGQSGNYLISNSRLSRDTYREGSNS